MMISAFFSSPAPIAPSYRKVFDEVDASAAKMASAMFMQGRPQLTQTMPLAISGALEV